MRPVHWDTMEKVSQMVESETSSAGTSPEMAGMIETQAMDWRSPVQQYSVSTQSYWCAQH